MKKITLFFVCLMFAGVSALWAQNVQVSGVVTDTGGPVIGATVATKSGKPYVTTDVNGRYSISVPANATLVFTSIGLKTQEVSLNGRTSIDVTMTEETRQLEEVIMVAYRAVEKSKQSASVATVNTKNLKDLPVTSFENALQGAASGVHVSTPNGQPGAQQQIRIRGIGSIYASSEPLYVIDGVPSNSGDYALSGYGGSYGIMNNLNPSDIENITILKDAAAIALYGSRGANGVIMVTTKKGKSGEVKVNFKGSWGFNDFAMVNRPILSGNQSRMLTLEGAYNQAIYNGDTKEKAEAYAREKVDKFFPARTEYSDWEKALTRQGRNTTYEVSATGGNERTTFYTSLAYRESLGMYVDSDLSGFSGKANFTHRGEKWTIEAGITLSKQEQNVAPGAEGGSTAYANPYFAARYYLVPNIPIYNEDGTFYKGSMLTGNFYNLVAEQGREVARNAMFKSTDNISFKYEFMPGLAIKETVSYDYAIIKGTTIWPYDSPNGKDFEGLTQIQDYSAARFYSSLLLTYDKTFAKDHTIRGLLGWDVDDSHETSLFGSGQGFASDLLWEIGAAAKPRNASSNHGDDRTVSFFGSVDYSYLNRYTFVGTFRRDGSTRLGSDTRWGNFWSLSGSWKMKEESFLRDVSWIDDMKFRASYGVSGNLPVGYYGSLSTYSYSLDYDGHPASAPARVSNPDLTWEKNYVLDFGLEARLFDRVNIEFDFYDRQTKDLLLEVPISYTTGFSRTLLNIGSMNNRGIELTLGVDVLKGDLSWNTSVILNHNRNKITELHNKGLDIMPEGTNYCWREGFPLYSFRMREWAGVDPGTGDSMWYSYEWENPDGTTSYAPYKPTPDSKLTGNKRITKDPGQATREIQGWADPDLTGGWKNTFSYKGLELDFLFSFSLGGSSYDGAWTMTADGTYSENPISVLQLNRWQKPGDQTNFPRRMFNGGHGNYLSTRWLHSTDHIRLKSVTLGYVLPQKWTKAIGLNNARVFVAGNNLLTWAAYKDYDPEVADGGVTDWSIPALRSFTFGVELGF